MKRVSVCIPTYNGAKYIGETIESVLNQTYEHLELIVVDNASSDGTESLMRRYISTDRRVRYHRCPAHVDIFSNFNRCFEHVTGDYIKFLCSDDLILPSQIEKQVAVLESMPNVALVACARSLIDGTGTVVDDDRRVIESDMRMRGREAVRISLECCQNFIGEPLNILFRADTVKKIGVFDPLCVYVGDWEYACRILGTGDFYYQAEVLARLRVHDEQYTQTTVRHKKVVIDNILGVYSRVFSHPETHGPYSFLEKHRVAAKILTGAVVETLLSRRESFGTIPKAFRFMLRHAPFYPFLLLFLSARFLAAFLAPVTADAVDRYERARKNILLLQKEQFTGAYMRQFARRLMDRVS